jgi:hypothetical protein
VVDGDDAQLGALGQGLVHWQGRAAEVAPGGVDRNGVDRGIGVARDVGDDAEAALGDAEGLEGHEGRSGGGAEENAVDEEVRLNDLGEGTALLGLLKIPLEDILLADLAAKLSGALSAATQSTNDDDPGGLAVDLDGGLEGGLDVGDEVGGLVEGRDGALRHAGVGDLVSPAEESDGSAGVAGRVAKGGDAAVLLVGQELEVVEGATALLEAAEPDLVAGLLLEDMEEGDVGMAKGTLDVGELLEAEDDVVGGGVGPGAGWDKLGAGGLELGILVDAVGGALDADDVAGVEEGLGAAGRD